jgi:hypothetical protein
VYLDLVPLDFDGVEIGAHWSELSQTHLSLLKPHQDFLMEKITIY